MLRGIAEGVIALDPQHRITLVNEVARQLLDLPEHAIGMSIGDLRIEGRLREVLVGENPRPRATDGIEPDDDVTAARDEVVIRRGRVLVMSTMRVVSGGRVLGTVTTMRDRTALADLEQEIGSFRSTAHVLRAQAHEFANQLHTISGLIQIGELDEVVRYVDALSERRDALDLTVNTLVRDPTIAALLMAKVATANERRVELTISDETTLERLEPEDAADVATVLGNLVDNALEHAPRGTASASWVRVRIRQDTSTVEIVVSDSGPGHPRRARAHRVRARGHDQACRPDGARRGARTHPARVPAAWRRDPRRAPGWRYVVRRPPRRRQPHRTRCGGVVLVIRVLIVDDDFMVARIHVGFVERVDGFEVVGVAHSAAEAADAVADLRPNLLLLDLYLPDRFGLDLLADLRTLPHACDAIVITAAKESDAVRAAVRLGVADYVLKPFGFPDLEERLKRYAAQRRLLDRTQVHGQEDVDRVFVACGGRFCRWGGAAKGDERRDGDVGTGRAAFDRQHAVGDRGRGARRPLTGQRPPLPRALRDHGSGGRAAALRLDRASRASLPLGGLTRKSQPLRMPKARWLL